MVTQCNVVGRILGVILVLSSQYCAFAHGPFKSHRNSNSNNDDNINNSINNRLYKAWNDNHNKINNKVDNDSKNIIPVVVEHGKNVITNIFSVTKQHSDETELQASTKTPRSSQSNDENNNKNDSKKRNNRSKKEPKEPENDDDDASSTGLTSFFFKSFFGRTSGNDKKGQNENKASSTEDTNNSKQKKRVSRQEKKQQKQESNDKAKEEKKGTTDDDVSNNSTKELSKRQQKPAKTTQKEKVNKAQNETKDQSSSKNNKNDNNEDEDENRNGENDKNDSQDEDNEQSKSSKKSSTSSTPDTSNPFNIDGIPTRTVIVTSRGPPQDTPPPGNHRQFPSTPSDGNGRPSQLTPALLMSYSLVSTLGSVARYWLLWWLIHKFMSSDEMLKPTQHFIWESINDRFTVDANVIRSVMSMPMNGFSKLSWRKYLRSIRPKKVTKPPKPTRTLVVLSVRGSDLEFLSEAITFLIPQYRSGVLGTTLEVVILLESPGGSVSEYGLAATNLRRLRESGIITTICVDRIGCSGGYMMACQANRLIAAPFAIVGSIGVVSETINFSNFLEKYGVRPLSLTAGEAKARLRPLGPVNEEIIEAEQEQLSKIHQSFIDLCLAQRPSLSESTCDGSVFLGMEAEDLGLVDSIQTSEEYIWDRVHEGNHVLQLHKAQPPVDRRNVLQYLLPRINASFKDFDIKNMTSIALQAASVLSVVAHISQQLLKEWNGKV